MPIRVLHIVTYMGRGGLETMLMNYYRQIDRSKVQFDFLVHREFKADYDKEIEVLGGRIYRLPKLNPFDPKYLNLLEQFFQEHSEYKIVHSHLDCMAGIPLKYAKKYGVPVRIAHAHTSNQTRDKKYLLKLLFKRNIKECASHLFACGEDAGIWMFRTKEFHVLNNAINARGYVYDVESRKTIRKKLGISEDTLVLGHVGRFAVPKNHKFILEIFEAISKQKITAKLLLIGDGELRSEIENLAKDKGLEKDIIFTGICSNVSEMLQAMDVFVFPSLYEGLPVSIVEAQAAGLPCLISDKVPIECKKTELVQQIKLEEGASVWAAQVCKAAEIQRRDTYEEIKESGFDIAANALWLEQFYLNVNKTDGLKL